MKDRRREETRHRAERGRFALVLDADWRDVSYPRGDAGRAVKDLRREETRHRAERGRFALVLDADWRDVSYPRGATLRAVTESQLRDLDSPRAKRRGKRGCRG